jgi:hypothetical protein
MTMPIRAATPLRANGRDKMRTHFHLSRRRALAIAAGVVMSPIAVSSRVQAAGGMSLFKVVTPKDEIFIGLTAEDIEKLGAGAPVELLAKKVAAEGQMTLWQYGVKRDEKGQMIFGSIGKVSIFAAGVVRIEPYKPAYEVAAPKP